MPSRTSSRSNPPRPGNQPPTRAGLGWTEAHSCQVMESWEGMASPGRRRRQWTPWPGHSRRPAMVGETPLGGRRRANPRRDWQGPALEGSPTRMDWPCGTTTVDRLSAGPTRPEGSGALSGIAPGLLAWGDSNWPFLMVNGERGTPPSSFRRSAGGAGCEPVCGTYLRP